MIFPKRELTDNKKIQYLVLLLGVVIYYFAWLNYSLNLDLITTYQGFSTYEWLVTREHTYITSIGFTNGLSDIYDKNLFFNLYAVLTEFLNIPADKMTQYIILLEFLSVLIFVSFLVKTLFSDLPKEHANLLIFIIFTYYVSSYAFSVDLARFSHKYQGLYYTFAELFRILAIVAILRKKYILGGLFLGITFLIHPIYTIIGTIFILSIFVLQIKHLKKTDFYKIFVAILVFFSFAVYGELNIYNIFSGIEKESIPEKDWFFWTVLGNFHWYPVEYGMFKEAHIDKLIGFFGVVLLFLYSIATKKTMNEIDKQIVFAWFVMLVVIILGMFFSWTHFSPFLVKISLIRASLLLVEISVFYIVYRFVQDIFDPNIKSLKVLLIFVLLITPFLTDGAPYPLVIVFALLIFDGYVNKFKNYNKFYRNILLIFSFITILFILYFYFNDYILYGLYKYIPLVTVNSFKYTYSLYVVWFLFFIVSISIIAMRRLEKEKALFIFLVIIITYCSYSYSTFPKGNSYRNLMKDVNSYKSVQLWVKENTPQDSLFLLDPTLASGWRSFSQRACFGLLREWTHTSLLYKADYYKDAMERLGEFSLNLDSSRYKAKPYLKQKYLLSTDVRDSFYNKKQAWFHHMNKKYGIDYVVMRKNLIKNKLLYKLVYQNDIYAVFKIKR